MMKLQNERISKWVLFLALMAFFPSLSYFILAFGLLPMSYIAYGIIGELKPLFVARTFQFDSLFISLILMVHLLLYGFIYFRLATTISSKMFRNDSKRSRKYFFAIIGSIILGSFFLPVYFIAGHGDIGPTNLLGVFETFWN